MKILFLDDSYQRNKKFLGYGGFCIDELQTKNLIQEILDLKDHFNIPHEVELKWSPPPEHYLNTKFKGLRKDVYKDAIKLLHKLNVKIICAVHDLNDCYGVKLYHWDFERIRLWATTQQFKYIAERFEIPILSNSTDYGLIIADHFSSIAGEKSLIREANATLKEGTAFREFQKLCLPPFTADPKDCSPLQLADIIVGVIVASLAHNHFGLDLFEDVAIQFLLDPHEDATSFASIMSTAVLGFGLTLFPSTFRHKGTEVFTELDKKYIYDTEGLKKKTV